MSIATLRHEVLRSIPSALGSISGLGSAGPIEDNAPYVPNPCSKRNLSAKNVITCEKHCENQGKCAVECYWQRDPKDPLRCNLIAGCEECPDPQPDPPAEDQPAW